MIKVLEMSYLDQYQINKLKRTLEQMGFIQPSKTVFFFVKDFKYKSNYTDSHDEIFFKVTFQEKRNLPDVETTLTVMFTVVGYTDDLKNSLRESSKVLVDNSVLNKKPSHYSSNLRFNNFEISKAFKLENINEINLAVKTAKEFFKKAEDLIKLWNMKNAKPFVKLRR